MIDPYILKQKAKAKYKLELLKVYDSPHYLAELLGYDVANHHKQILDFLVRTNPLPKRSLTLAPRGAGKSTMATIVYPLWRLLRDPDLRILIVSNTQHQSIGFLREIRKHIEQSVRLEALFGILVGEKWTQVEIDLSIRRNITKEGNITAFGVFGALIARHYDLIIMDDVVDLENAKTETTRAQLMQWFGMSLMPTLEPHGEIVMVGTRYHLHDLYANMIANQYKDDFLIIRAIDDDGVSFWPEKFTIEFLENIRKEISTPIFNAQYQNDPRDMTGGLFKPEWFRNKWQWVNNDCIAVPDSEAIHIQHLNIYMGVDLAIGQRKVHDYTAIVIVGYHQQTGDIYILECVKGRWTPEETRLKIINVYDRWNNKTAGAVARVAIESIAFQESMIYALKSTYPAMPVVGVKPHTDKVTRITPIIAMAENNRIFTAFDGTTDLLIDELIEFPQGQHDDMCDALEMAITGSRRGATITHKPEGM